VTVSQGSKEQIAAFLSANAATSLAFIKGHVTPKQALVYANLDGLEQDANYHLCVH
jgi:hypothetical protein